MCTLLLYSVFIYTTPETSLTAQKPVICRYTQMLLFFWGVSVVDGRLTPEKQWTTSLADIVMEQSPHAERELNKGEEWSLGGENISTLGEELEAVEVQRYLDGHSINR